MDISEDFGRFRYLIVFGKMIIVLFTLNEETITLVYKNILSLVYLRKVVKLFVRERERESDRQGTVGI